MGNSASQNLLGFAKRSRQDPTNKKPEKYFYLEMIARQLGQYFILIFSFWTSVIEAQRTVVIGALNGSQSRLQRALMTAGVIAVDPDVGYLAAVSSDHHKWSCWNCTIVTMGNFLPASLLHELEVVLEIAKVNRREDMSYVLKQLKSHELKFAERHRKFAHYLIQLYDMAAASESRFVHLIGPRELRFMDSTMNGQLLHDFDAIINPDDPLDKEDVLDAFDDPFTVLMDRDPDYAKDYADLQQLTDNHAIIKMFPHDILGSFRAVYLDRKQRILYSNGAISSAVLLNSRVIDRPINDFATSYSDAHGWNLTGGAKSIQTLLQSSSGPISMQFYESEEMCRQITAVMEAMQVKRLIVAESFEHDSKSYCDDRVFIVSSEGRDEQTRRVSASLSIEDNGDIFKQSYSPTRGYKIKKTLLAKGAVQKSRISKVLSMESLKRKGLPPRFPKNDHPVVYAFGDIHGDVVALLNNLKVAGLIDYDSKFFNEMANSPNLNQITDDAFDDIWWTGGKSTVVLVGDIMDRGPADIFIWRLIFHLYNEAKMTGGIVEPLLGNHEILNLFDDFQSIYPDFSMRQALINRHHDISLETKLGKFIRTRKTVVQIGNTVFSHAGMLPNYAALGIDEINKRVTNCLTNPFDASCFMKEMVFNNEGPMWTRRFSGLIEDDFEMCNILQMTLYRLRATRMVVGHTIQRSRNVKPNCGGRLINVDVGLSRWTWRETATAQLVIAGIRIDSQQQRVEVLHSNGVPSHISVSAVHDHVLPLHNHNV